MLSQIDSFESHDVFLIVSMINSANRPDGLTQHNQYTIFTSEIKRFLFQSS